jgi:hypothetical protein
MKRKGDVDGEAMGDTRRGGEEDDMDLDQKSGPTQEL